MQLPRRSVRSIQSLPSIYTAFPANYKPVRTHSASTASNSARSPDVEDGLEVVPLEHDSIRSAPIVSAYLDEKEVFINTQELLEKPLPNVPTSLWGRTWGRMSIKYRVFAILGLQALVLLTVGTALLTMKAKPPDDHPEVQSTGDGSNETSSIIPLERGTFLVPIHFPQQQSSACLARANESRAWQCAFDSTLQLSILPSLGDDDKSVMITLGPQTTLNRSIHCGQQAPEIGPTVLKALDPADDGPQFHFSATYDRVVILREDQLGQERVSSSPMQDQPKHTTFLPGQALWRCISNDTLLEGYIYTNKEAEIVHSTTETAPTTSLAFPYRLKLAESKVASGSAPYCEKVVVGVDADLGSTGESVHLELVNTQSESLDDSDASCQCQWVVG